MGACQDVERLRGSAACHRHVYDMTRVVYNRQACLRSCQPGPEFPWRPRATSGPARTGLGRGASGACAPALPGPRGGACPCDRLRLGAPPSGTRRPASSSTCRSRPGARRSPAPGSISVRGGAAAPRQHMHPLGSRPSAGAALVCRRGRGPGRASSETCAGRGAQAPCTAGAISAPCAWRLCCRSTRSGRACAAWRGKGAPAAAGPAASGAASRRARLALGSPPALAVGASAAEPVAPAAPPSAAPQQLA